MAGFLLPRPGTEAREAMGDIEHVVEVLNPANIAKMSPMRDAIRSAKRLLAESPAARRVNVICLRANDERWLISVGPRGGVKRLWNFGAGR